MSTMKDRLEKVLTVAETLEQPFTRGQLWDAIVQQNPNLVQSKDSLHGILWRFREDVPDGRKVIKKLRRVGRGKYAFVDAVLEPEAEPEEKQDSLAEQLERVRLAASGVTEEPVEPEPNDTDYSELPLEALQMILSEYSDPIIFGSDWNDKTALVAYCNDHRDQLA